MAQTYTQNLNIPKMNPETPLLHTQIDNALERIDVAALPVTHADSKMHWPMWEAGKQYQKKDVFRTETIPSWGYWEVTKAGTSGTTAPVGYGEGDTATNGTCELILRRLTQGGGGAGDPVGRVVFDVVLRAGYIRADGAAHPSASLNYPRLMAFLDAHPELLAADSAAYAANVGLYLYDSGTDELTVPNYIGRVMQGGNSLEEKKAGLPNIKGDTRNLVNKNGTLIGTTGLAGQLSVPTNINSPYSNGAFTIYGVDASYASGRGTATSSDPNRSMYNAIAFNAHNSNSIYSDTVSTVQPPAITLIPQIKY